MDAATPHHDLLRYTIPPSAPSLLPPLAGPAPSSCIPSHTVSTAPPQISLPTVDSGTASMEQGGLEHKQELQEGVVPMEMHPRVVPVLRTWPSSSSKKKKKKKESSKTCGETQRADDACVERQITSETHMDQRDSSKVEMTQLKNSKTPRRKMSPIVSRSPIMNMIARKKAQSPSRTSKSPMLHARSPNSHPRSPNPAGTSRFPNLHDLSPTPAHGTPTTSDELPPTATNGSKRKPQKLTSIVWNDAKPIYIDGLLTQGRCKYCNTVFLASKVYGSSQLARHLKVCEVKCSMDGVVQQIRTSDEIDPDWKFDQQVARIELVKLIVLHGLPFSFFEYAGFRKFCASLNPWFKSVNRVTVQNDDCMDVYYSYRSNYQSFFMNCNHRVSLTGDM